MYKGEECKEGGGAEHAQVPVYRMVWQIMRMNGIVAGINGDC